MDIIIYSGSIFKMKEFYFIVYILIVNLYGIFIMGADKYKATGHRWRISESHIFITALLGGAAGVMMGMLMFHHKTQHNSFSIGIPMIFILNMISGIIMFHRIYLR